MIKFINLFFYILQSMVIFLSINLLNAQSLSSLYQKELIQFEKDWVVGGGVVDENYSFTNISKICIDSKGKLFVLDSGENCVKIFDHYGKYIKTFGRKGNGPGELQQAFYMSIDPMDNIVIYDSGNLRFSKFNNKEVFINTIRFGGIITNFNISSSGDYYIETTEYDPGGKKGGTLIKISQFSPDLKTENIVDSERILDSIIIIKESTGKLIPVPFHPKLMWSLFPSGRILIARSEDYSLKIFSSDLKLINEIRHKAEQIKVTKQDNEKYFSNMMTSFISGRKVKSKTLGFDRKIVKFPIHKPYFSNIWIDQEGNILIQTLKTEDQHVVFDIFTKEGDFLNKVKMSNNITNGYNSIFYNNIFYQISESDEEFPKIIRYNLRL